MSAMFLRAIALGLLGIAIAYAQEQPIFRVDVRQVYLPFLPVAKGRVVDGLIREHVRVFENNTEQKVLSLTRHAQHPIALALMLDSTGSMRAYYGELISRKDKLEIVRNAAKDLLRSLFRPGKDVGLVAEFFLDGYSPIPYINQDWTNDLVQLERGIASINDASGSTPVRDAAYNLAGKFASIEGTYLRVAVILSDGLDTEDNTYTLEKAIAQLQRWQVLVYAVGMYKELPFMERGKHSPDVLRKIAEETGGVMFYEANLGHLAEVFRYISDTIRNVYFLSYAPTNNEDGKRVIRVEIGARDAKGKWHRQKATIFHRKGYIYKKQP